MHSNPRLPGPAAYVCLLLFSPHYLLLLLSAGGGPDWRHHSRHPGGDQINQWGQVYDHCPLAGGVRWSQPDLYSHLVLQVSTDKQR